jgi:hypothetical protein
MLCRVQLKDERAFVKIGRAASIRRRLASLRSSLLFEIDLVTVLSYSQADERSWQDKFEHLRLGTQPNAGYSGASVV